MKLKFFVYVFFLVLMTSCTKTKNSETLNFYDIETSIARKLVLINNLSQLGTEKISRLSNKSVSEKEKDVIVSNLGFESYSQMLHEFNSIQSSLNIHFKENPDLKNKDFFIAKYGFKTRQVLLSQNFYKSTITSITPFKYGSLETTSSSGYGTLDASSGCCPCTDAYNRAVDQLTFTVALAGLGAIAGGAAAIAASLGVATGVAGGTLLYIAAYYTTELTNLENCWSSCVTNGYQNCW